MPLNYVLRQNKVANYGKDCSRIEVKLKNFVIFTLEAYSNNSESSYDILVQHVGFTEPGSNIITKYRRMKNGRKCNLYLKKHFLASSYCQNKSQQADKDIIDALYI